MKQAAHTYLLSSVHKGLKVGSFKDRKSQLIRSVSDVYSVSVTFNLTTPGGVTLLC